jgi:hypothetical protein
LDQWLYDIEIMGDFEFNGNKYDIKGDQEWEKSCFLSMIKK